MIDRGYCTKCGQLHPWAPVENVAVIEHVAAPAATLFSLGLREMSHRSGRRMQLATGASLGLDIPSNRILCWDGDDLVAIAQYPAYAFRWLMTGEWPDTEQVREWQAAASKVSA